MFEYVHKYNTEQNARVRKPWVEHFWGQRMSKTPARTELWHDYNRKQTRSRKPVKTLTIFFLLMMELHALLFFFFRGSTSMSFLLFFIMWLRPKEGRIQGAPIGVSLRFPLSYKGALSGENPCSGFSSSYISPSPFKIL
jgi:hypothetical protein